MSVSRRHVVAVVAVFAALAGMTVGVWWRPWAPSPSKDPNEALCQGTLLRGEIEKLAASTVRRDALQSGHAGALREGQYWCQVDFDDQRMGIRLDMGRTVPDGQPMPDILAVPYFDYPSGLFQRPLARGIPGYLKSDRIIAVEGRWKYTVVLALPKCSRWTDPGADPASAVPESRMLSLGFEQAVLTAELETRLVRQAVVAANRVLDLNRCDQPRLTSP